ncbi:unnamed protein product [Trifolium pratense]|uniref:Uncharacterized protein n=1 Tax=Trifolium pratense TaxID=57577 RepID=A0ACB0KJ38_TRIPR|nr:unnamed protein product [Trifolium pratense]
MIAPILGVKRSTSLSANASKVASSQAAALGAGPFPLGGFPAAPPSRLGPFPPGGFPAAAPSSRILQSSLSYKYKLTLKLWLSIAR